MRTEYYRQYRQTDAYRASQARYRQSEKGREAHRRASARHRAEARAAQHAECLPAAPLVRWVAEREPGYPLPPHVKHGCVPETVADGIAVALGGTLWDVYA